MKPKFYESDVVASVGFMERLMLKGLSLMADREGRLEDRPMLIKGQLFRYDDLTVEHIENGLVSLANVGLIVRYESKGSKYIQVVEFEEDESPHVMELPSTIPAPDKHRTRTIQARCKNPLIADSGSLIPDTGLRIAAERARPRPLDDSPVIGRFTLKDGAVFNVTELMAAPWPKAYPHCDLRCELAKMDAWCFAHPERRKTRRGAMKFANGWMARAEESARAAPPKPSEPVDPGPEFWAKDCLRIQQEEDAKRAERKRRIEAEDAALAAKENLGG